MEAASAPPPAVALERASAACVLSAPRLPRSKALVRACQHLPMMEGWVGRHLPLQPVPSSHQNTFANC